MTKERIKEIQNKTGYSDSISVQQALLQVWKECEQEQLRIHDVSIAKRTLPRPLEAWKSAREKELSEYIEWHLEQEKRGTEW